MYRTGTGTRPKKREEEVIWTVAEFDVLYDCGIHQPLHTIKLNNRSQYISDAAKHYSGVLCKAELDLMIDGLKVNRVLNESPTSMQQLFFHMQPPKVTADYILSLFKKNFFLLDQVILR